MDLRETLLERKDIYAGRVVRLHVDTVRLPDGGTSLREIVDHPGGVAIVALDEQNRVAVVRQFRYAFDRVVLEIPAGKREVGEEPLLTARRELQEEVGATASQWTELGAILPSPGCYGETLHLFLAKNLTFGSANPDQDEFLKVERVPLDELLRRILKNEIADAKTVAGVLKAKLYLDI